MDPSVVQSVKKHFLSDWKNAIPAEEKIREIEEGITIRDGSKILENKDEVLSRIKYNIEGSEELLVCTNLARMQLLYNNFLDSYKKIPTRYKDGKHKGIRWVGTIEKDSIFLVRFFLKFLPQIKREILSNVQILIKLRLQVTAILLIHPILYPTLLLPVGASIIFHPKEQLLSAVVVRLDLQILITHSMMSVFLLKNLQMVCGFLMQKK